MLLCTWLQVVEVALRMPAPVPVCQNAEELGTDIVKSLLSSSENRYVEELRRLLQKPHIKVRSKITVPLTGQQAAMNSRVIINYFTRNKISRGKWEIGQTRYIDQITIQD